MWSTLLALVVLAYTSIAYPTDLGSTQGEHITIDNDNVTIHYVKYGKGPYLILQHGFPDRESTWNDFQIPPFAQSYTVLTPTLRGFPPSSIPLYAENYTSDRYVSDINAILDYEKAENVSLVGHDFGGAIVQFFSRAYPARVNAMIIMNAPVAPTFLPLIEYDKEEQYFARYTIPYYTYEPGQPKNISTLVEHIRNMTYQAEIAEYLEHSPIDGMLHFYDENYPGPPYGRNLSIYGIGPNMVQKVPSMLLWGQEDPYFSPKLIDGLESWFAKGIRLVTVPNSGHWVFRDQWERANREVVNFLKISADL